MKMPREIDVLRGVFSRDDNNDDDDDDDDDKAGELAAASLVRRRQGPEGAEASTEGIKNHASGASGFALENKNRGDWVGGAKAGDIEVNLRRLARVALRHGRYNTYKQLQKRLKRIEVPASPRDGAARRNARLRRLLTERARTARNLKRKKRMQAEDEEADVNSAPQSALQELFDISDLAALSHPGRAGPRIWERCEIPATPSSVAMHVERRESEGDRNKGHEDQQLLSGTHSGALEGPVSRRLGRKRLDLTPQQLGQRVIGILPHKQQQKQILFERFQGVDRKADSPRSTYAEYCESHRILPEPLGLSETEPRALNLRHFGIGDAHAAAVACGLRTLHDLRTLDLRENRLGDSAVTTLLDNSAHLKLRNLDLSENRISRNAAKALGCVLRTSATLRVVKLNKVQFAADAFERICRALRVPTCKVRILHLSDTGIGQSPASASALGKMIAQNKSLVALNVSWNNLSGTGADALAEGLRVNRTLHTLDARWNMIGTGAKALSAAFAKNRALTHVDLSYNHIDADQCKELAQGLNLNHSILGLHMAGNAYKVSPAGFLTPRKYAVLDSSNAHRGLATRGSESICNAELRHDPSASLKRRAALQREKAAKEAEERATKAADPFAAGPVPRRRGRLAINGSQYPAGAVSPCGAEADAKQRLEAATSADPAQPGRNDDDGGDASTPAADGPLREKQQSRVLSFRSAIVAVTSRNRKQHLPSLLDVVRLKKEREGQKASVQMEQTPSECENCWICARWREVRVDFVDFAAAEQAAMASAAEEIRRQEEREELRRQMENNPYKQRIVPQKTAPPSRPKFKPRNVELFLSIDGFRRPRKLGYVEGDFKYEVHVMLPPGRCEFFFTVDGEANRVLAPNMHAADASPEARHAFELMVGRKQDLSNGDAVPVPWRPQDKTPPPKQPYRKNGPLRLHSFAILERLERTLPEDVRAAPRRQNTRALPRHRLSFIQEDGVFAGHFKERTEDTVKAFKADCSHAKFQRMVKDKHDRNNMLAALQENYNVLRVAYQLFCASGSGLSVTSVSWHSFFEMCQMCHIIDDQLEQKDLENMFVAVNVNDGSKDQGVDTQGRKLNPDRDLCRYEFVEIVGRIALQKFYRRKVVDSPADAVRRLIEAHLIPYLDIEAPQVFRDRFLYTRPVDVIFQHFMPVLQRLFRRNADANMNRKQKRMTFMSWKHMLAKSGIFSNSACTERESRLSYRLSMAYMEDEMKSDEHLSIGFKEFLEALARLAFLCDQASLEHLVKRFVQIFHRDEQDQDPLRPQAVEKQPPEQREGQLAGKDQECTSQEPEAESVPRSPTMLAKVEEDIAVTNAAESDTAADDATFRTPLPSSEGALSKALDRQATFSETDLEEMLREDPDADASGDGDNSSDDDDDDVDGTSGGSNGGASRRDGGNLRLSPTSGFPLKLALLLRILIWHPTIYDRANCKATSMDKRHQEILARRGSLRIASRPSLMTK